MVGRFREDPYEVAFLGRQLGHGATAVALQVLEDARITEDVAENRQTVTMFILLLVTL